MQCRDRPETVCISSVSLVHMVVHCSLYEYLKSKQIHARAVENVSWSTLHTVYYSFQAVNTWLHHLHLFLLYSKYLQLVWTFTATSSTDLERRSYTGWQPRAWSCPVEDVVPQFITLWQLDWRGAENRARNPRNSHKGPGAFGIHVDCKKRKHECCLEKNKLYC